MFKRVNTATREVLTRSVRCGRVAGANYLKERYSSTRVQSCHAGHARHTPTRSLGGAETGRSAMNGNDGPFACAACKLVFEHQNAAAHSCKQCKLPVHSWVACDMVWMPQEGEYFCGKPCLEAYNASGVRSEGALRPLRQRVDSPVEPPGQGGA